VIIPYAYSLIKNKNFMKRTPIVTALLLAGMLLTFNACKKGVDPVPTGTEKTETGAVTVENGRLAFETNKDYYKYIETVKTETSAKAGFRSLYAALQAGYKKTDSDPGLSSTLTDLDQFNFPEGFLATLNEKGEVKIGDEIIWYHNGNKYFIPASEEANLETVKQSPNRIKKFFPYLTSVPKNARQYITVTSLDARNQKEFFPLDASGAGLVGSDRKYVHEIYGKFDPYTDPSLPGIQLHKAYFILRLKMEWRGSRGWNANASEPRTESVSISGFAKLPGMGRLSGYDLGPNFTLNDTRSNIRENVEYTLVIADVVGGFTNGNNWWDCEINGTLTSSFVGATAASGEWINTGALW
jgi:hypothetical protein